MAKSPQFNLYDRVKITSIRKPIGIARDGISRRKPIVGDIAFVVMVYTDPPGYELQCCDAEGIPWFLISVSSSSVISSRLFANISVIVSLVTSKGATPVSTGISSLSVIISNHSILGAGTSSSIVTSVANIGGLSSSITCGDSKISSSNHVLGSNTISL